MKTPTYNRLGPERYRGGYIIATGTPEEVAMKSDSLTGIPEAVFEWTGATIDLPAP